ncbi:MAG: hypothetical protein V4556_12590 [Bacteroidota bacterium]
MFKALFSIFLIILSSVTFAQVDSAYAEKSKHTVNHKKRSIIPNIIIAEAFIFGTSYYASKPDIYGDKVVGGLYGISAVSMLGYIPFYLTSKKHKADSNFKKKRIVNVITMAAVSYGFTRIATYNLLHADNDSNSKRFKRNLIESHAAYFIPMLTGALAEKLILKNKPKNKVKTALYFDGSELHFAMTFK